MARAALFVFLVFAILLLLRIIRVLARGLAARNSGGASARGALEGEMVRDPVCGTWIDRRLALAGRKSGEWVPVCSETCRSRLEAS